MGEADIPIPEIMELYEAEDLMKDIENTVHSWRRGENPSRSLSYIKAIIKSHDMETKCQQE
jgi:hypothetical protein